MPTPNPDLSLHTCIQDPAWPDSSYLLEEILIASQGATSGAGAFAFASEAGIKLLFHDSDFQKFLSKYPFHLTIGVDAITDTKALKAISSCVAENQNLKARVFWGPVPGTIFHPKLCWFRSRLRAKALVGSGNLTAGGLRGNCEAFSIAELTATQLASWETKWTMWSEFHKADFLALDDPRVVKQADQNAIANAKTPKTTNQILIEENDGKISVGRSRHDSDAVLIAEIPRGGSRWNQANFNLETFRGFFGASPGRTQRIILTHVGTDGALGEQEIRPSVSVKSNNHRFELEAASGLEYPIKGRPIAIFVRVATRTFRYRLLMPGDHAYRRAAAYLAQNVEQEGSQMRRLVTYVKTVRTETFVKNLIR